MSDVQLTDKMPLDEVKKSEAYARLTPKQQVWAATYIQNGMEHGHYDAVLATKLAFKCKSMNNARVMSYSLISNVHIIEVLNLHFRTEPIDAFLKMIDRAIANKKVTHAQVEALRLKCELLGLANRLPIYLGEERGVKLPNGIEKVPAISSDPEKQTMKYKKPKKSHKKATEKKSTDIPNDNYGF